MERGGGIPAATPRGLAAGATTGFLVGILSGFAGVGGGEYRSPVLLGLLRDVRVSVTVNLAVGVVVSYFTFGLRVGNGVTGDGLYITLALIASSLPGAYLATGLTRRVSPRVIKAVLACILVVTGLRLLLIEVTTPGALRLTPWTVALALLFGFGLGMISGFLGLAAGEYRIPALVLVFGIPTRVAGTLSSLAAIPQQLLAYWRHRTVGHATRTGDRLSLAMAATSVVGVALGVFYLGRTTDETVTRVLGALMIAAALRVAWEAVAREAIEGPTGAPPQGTPAVQAMAAESSTDR